MSRACSAAQHPTWNQSSGRHDERDDWTSAPSIVIHESFLGSSLRIVGAASAMPCGVGSDAIARPYQVGQDTKLVRSWDQRVTGRATVAAVLIIPLFCIRTCQ